MIFMRACRAAVTLLLVGCGSDSSGIVLEISSAVTPLGRVTVSVMGARGALLDEGQVGELDPELPLRVLVEPSGRRESVRALGWGWRQQDRVAFGQIAFDVDPDVERVVQLRLEAMVADSDQDGIPDPTDACPEVADPGQEDADGDGVTDACAARCPGNVLVNPDFEDTIDPWIDENADLVLDDAGLSGRALAVCYDGEGSDWAAKDRMSVLAPMPGSYHLEAWIRPLTETEQLLDLDLKVLDSSNSSIDSYGDDEVMIDGSVYHKLVRDFAVDVAGDKLEVQIESCLPSPGACFLLDSLCLEIAP